MNNIRRYSKIDNPATVDDMIKTIGAYMQLSMMPNWSEADILFHLEETHKDSTENDRVIALLTMVEEWLNLTTEPIATLMDLLEASASGTERRKSICLPNDNFVRINWKIVRKVVRHEIERRASY